MTPCGVVPRARKSTNSSYARIMARYPKGSNVHSLCTSRQITKNLTSRNPDHFPRSHLRPPLLRERYPFGLYFRVLIERTKEVFRQLGTFCRGQVGKGRLELFERWGHDATPDIQPLACA